MFHLCHIATTFNQRSGSARRTKAILEGCRAKGYRVSLITGRDHDIAESDLPGVSVHVIPELVKYLDPLQDWKAFLSLRRLLMELRPDLVHTHLAKAGISGRLAARLVNTPLILHTVHGPTFPKQFPWLQRHLFRLLERTCGRWTDQFVFVGAELRESYISDTVCRRKNSMVIHTGRPDEVFEREPLPESQGTALRTLLCDGVLPPFLMLAVGRIVPAKQFEDALRILKIVRDQGVDAHLAIVGSALLSVERTYESSLQEEAKKKKLLAHVHFCGFREDVLDLMEAADVILLTSQYEGLPNVAVEAVIAGTPMVSYHVAGVSEVLEEGRSGWVVPPGDVILAAERVLAIAHLRVRLGRGSDSGASRARLRKFRESAMVDSKLQLYAKLLQQKADSGQQ